MREVSRAQPPDIALANHLVMGPVVLARALATPCPYAVKIHGSALEYVVKRDPERFLPYAREGLARARGVLVGSRHTAESLWEAMGDPELPAAHAPGPARRRRRGVPPAGRRRAARVARAGATSSSTSRRGAVESAFARDAARRRRRAAPRSAPRTGTSSSSAS